jgi:hypothetical protein
MWKSPQGDIHDADAAGLEILSHGQSVATKSPGEGIAALSRCKPSSDPRQARTTFSDSTELAEVHREKDYFGLALQPVAAKLASRHRAAQNEFNLLLPIPPEMLPS